MSAANGGDCARPGQPTGWREGAAPPRQDALSSVLPLRNQGDVTANDGDGFGHNMARWQRLSCDCAVAGQSLGRRTRTLECVVMWIVMLLHVDTHVVPCGYRIAQFPWRNSCKSVVMWIVMLLDVDTHVVPCGYGTAPFSIDRDFEWARCTTCIDTSMSPRKAKPLVTRDDDSRYARIRCAPIALDLGFDAKSTARARVSQITHGASR